MNSLQRNLFAAAALALALAAPAATAGLIVTAPAYTPNSGYAGDATIFQPRLTITSDGVTDFQNVYSWDFRVDWNELALVFDDTNPGTISFGTGGGDAYSGSLTGLVAFMSARTGTSAVGDNLSTAETDGFYRFHWESDASEYADLGAGIEFTGAFTINPSYVVLVDTAVDFDFSAGGIDSDVVGQSLNSSPYSGVTNGSPMRVTVLAPQVQVQPAPEPGMPMLLLGGLVAFFAARRMRRVALS